MNTRPTVRAWARLGLLVAALTAVATPSWSKVYVLDRGDNVLVRVFYRFFGPPDSGPQQIYRTIADPETCATFQLKNPHPDCQTAPNSNCFYHHITASGCVDRSTDPSTTSSYALVTGNAKAGPSGLGTSAFDDTVYAEASVRVGVRRLGLLITLSNLAVQLRVNPGGLGNPGGLPEPARIRLIVAVYPDTLTALADQADLRGTGARFFGVVYLASGTNALSATAPVAGVPGFAAGDFLLTTLAGGILQATPADTFLRAIFVPNASNAAVVMANDPSAGFDAAADDAPTAPPLGVLQQFSVLGNSGVTGSTGLGTVVDGDVGSSPTPSITNFPPSSVTPAFALHLANDLTVQQAHTDAIAAYNFLAGQGPGTVLSAQLNGAVLTSGIYSFAGGAADLAALGTLTLNGPGIFVFQVNSALTANVGSRVIGTADPHNVFWRVGTSATLNGSSFLGNVIADASITIGSGSSVTGRAIAGTGPTGAVTMAGAGGNTIGGCASHNGTGEVGNPTGLAATTLFEALGPNPTGDAARLTFSLARPARVQVTVHEIAGRLVRAMDVGSLPPGRHQATWDGLGSDGRRVRAGLYWVGLEVDGRRLPTRRLTMLR